MFSRIRKFAYAVAATTTGVLVYKFAISKLSRKKSERYIVIQSIDDWMSNKSEILETFKKSRVIGVDCEWVTVGDKRNPVSLLQLANDSGFCVLIRLSRLPLSLIPTEIAELLEDEELLKVGVGIHDDANKLFNDYGLDVYGLLDLRFLARYLDEMQGKNMGLKSLAKELLDFDLDKGKSLRCSDWDADTLSAEQIKYAADDAIVAAEIFKEIQERKSSWISVLSTVFWRDVQKYVDVPFKQKFISDKKNAGSNPLKRSQKTRYSKPRQKVMYDNCQLIAPDGELLCSCDRGKAQWYADKGLGEVINDEPFTVQLNFEPSGRPTLDNIFYTKEKSNLCCVCGKTENFHRKNVVPSEYRRNFPNLMKKNLSHDILLLCVNCHKKSNILDQDMRQKLAQLCDAPLGCKKNVKYNLNSDLARVKSAATALATSGPKIPETRREELKSVLADYFEVESVTEDHITEAKNLIANSLNDSFISHGFKVYQYFCKNEGLIQLEKLWRQHFLDSMQPKYLPSMWSVEHNHKRLAIQVINHERDVDFDESILGLSPELVEEIKNQQN